MQRQSNSCERLSSASASKKSFLGSVLLWSCLLLTGMIAISLLSPARSVAHVHSVLHLISCLLTYEAPVRMFVHSCVGAAAPCIRRDISHLRLRITRNVREHGRMGALGVSLAPAADTLVLYTYSNSDPQYERNLHFFVKHGLSEGDGCDYLFIVQQARTCLCSLLAGTQPQPSHLAC